MKDFFSFRSLGGDFAELGAAIENRMPVAAFGLSDARKYLTCALVRGRALYVTADALTAQRAAESIAALSGKKVSRLAAKDEVLTYRKALSSSSFPRRCPSSSSKRGRSGTCAR